MEGAEPVESLAALAVRIPSERAREYARANAHLENWGRSRRGAASALGYSTVHIEAPMSSEPEAVEADADLVEVALLRIKRHKGGRLLFRVARQTYIYRLGSEESSQMLWRRPDVRRYTETLEQLWRALLISMGERVTSENK